MPRIPSANPDFRANDQPTTTPKYRHGVEERQSFVPMAFQVMSPVNHRLALLPHALVMHVNPQNLSETHTKKIERIQTKGGFVEQHWGDDLSEISADGVTGAFMNVYTGLASVARQRTIAWDRYRDLHDLYRNNGAVYDPFGNIVLQGQIALMYDRGVYLGLFHTFQVEETADSPFMFKMSWTFKVETTILQVPTMGTTRIGPVFQQRNQPNVKPISANQTAFEQNLISSNSGNVAAPPLREVSDQDIAGLFTG